MNISVNVWTVTLAISYIIIIIIYIILYYNLAHANTDFEAKIKEALYIKKHKPKLNNQIYISVVLHFR